MRGADQIKTRRSFQTESINKGLEVQDLGKTKQLNASGSRGKGENDMDR